MQRSGAYWIVSHRVWTEYFFVFAYGSYSVCRLGAAYLASSFTSSVCSYLYCVLCLSTAKQTGAITNGKGASYYVGGSQTLPRGGIYNDRNKNVVGKFVHGKYAE